MVGHFKVPGESTKRDLAVYVVVANNRDTFTRHLYIGKTGDNREGCNPVISRAGNHFSFNKVHSQVRNKLVSQGPVDQFDYDYFYVSFGSYDPPTKRKALVALVNEMERQTNLALQELVSKVQNVSVLNPYKGTSVWGSTRSERERLCNNSHAMAKVRALVSQVGEHIGIPGEAA